MQRNDWSLPELRVLYETPLLSLISEAHQVHRRHHFVGEIQVCYLISFKTGGCLEDCSYCPQSSHYPTAVQPQPLLKKEEMVRRAKEAQLQGATRICLAAAWIGVKEGKAFDTLLETIQAITAEGLEVCCTLGKITPQQGEKLAKAGLYAYNHNLDSSREFYPKIITTRTYDERLATLDVIEASGISLCCGGILGMGESMEDRISFIHTLATRQQHPESVPLNFLMPVEGTPLEKNLPLPIWDMVRLIALARISMPHSLIRLTAGRIFRTIEEQTLCFFAGANSLFSGEKLLTQPNPHFPHDDAMFEILGIKKRAAFKKGGDPKIAKFTSQRELPRFLFE